MSSVGINVDRKMLCTTYVCVVEFSGIWSIVSSSSGGCLECRRFTRRLYCVVKFLAALTAHTLKKLLPGGEIKGAGVVLKAFERSYKAGKQHLAGVLV